MTAADRARREAVEQGLPPVVTNPMTLARVARLLHAAGPADPDPLCPDRCPPSCHGVEEVVA